MDVAQQITTQPENKEKLGKTFIRGVVGGIGWVVGMSLGWLAIILVLITLYNQFNLGDKIEQYIQDFVLQTTEKQLQNQQNIIKNLVPSNLQINNKAVDIYQEDIQRLLQQNKQ